MSNTIYVHIDTTSNAVLTRGLAPQDFNKSIVHQPKNLLLLDPSSDFGEFDGHTGLKVIRGMEDVQLFFQQINKGRIAEEMKWIDFNDYEMVKELTPLEISELLYFGHMKTHLHSPFFYKLQNNFVFFDLKDARSRVYYRYLDEYYRILADRITRIVLEKINDRLSFFKKATPVEKLDFNLLKELRGIMQEGIVFCLTQEQLIDRTYTIPIYLSEDAGLKNTLVNQKELDQIAVLRYSASKKNWSLEIDQEDLAFGFFDKKMS
ncbi:hypothetical protein ACOJB1_15695 [Enterococcus innesii]|uniref:hypothetical protein n=1 Tax=Enterococcus innesii TaxID=2839759 RepID=UPI003B598AA4